MAESTVIAIPRPLESELKELPRTPPTRSPIGTPVPVPSTPSRAATAGVVDRTLSGASNLVNLLPTGTVLAFQTLSPSFANKGKCYTSNKCLTSVLILLCSLSCVFFSLTDSLLGEDGKLYYGIATVKGFYLFNYEGDEEERAKAFGRGLRRLRLRPLDCVHALFSVLVLLSLTFSDSDIQTCLFPGAGKDAKELLVNLPLGAAVVSSLVFMILPTSRKGIGYAAPPHPR
ncbi:uncharacterized protein M6B38_101050 [Iris pallida]|uniref:Uncharacterized protein n=1 Tax=Iris pallida TaxID=29817 RepID=A0AAX6ILH2_IRIPA|nr:uncharacterized protein M6B38_101050 [Iris pallida]